MVTMNQHPVILSVPSKTTKLKNKNEKIKMWDVLNYVVFIGLLQKDNKVPNINQKRSDLLYL